MGVADGLAAIDSLVPADADADPDVVPAPGTRWHPTARMATTTRRAVMKRFMPIGTRPVTPG